MSGGVLAEANNYMTKPIIQRTNEIIEDYCKTKSIDIFVLYPPYAIQYANGETNDFPDSSDSLYIAKLKKCSIPEVTDTILRLLNTDPKIADIQKKIGKEYEIYKRKMNVKIDSLIKMKK